MITPERMLEAARIRAEKAGYNNYRIDVGDLQGFIVEALLHYKPETEWEMRRVIERARIDWIRGRLGRQGQKMDIAHALSMDMKMAAGGGYYYEDIANFHDIIPSYDSEYDSSTQGVDAFIQELKPRYQTVARMRMEGFTLKEIGYELGVSESRISQIQSKIEKKIKARLHSSIA